MLDFIILQENYKLHLDHAHFVGILNKRLVEEQLQDLKKLNIKMLQEKHFGKYKEEKYFGIWMVLYLVFLEKMEDHI